MNDAPISTDNAFNTEGNWTREQTLLAFRFYCETPFGQLHARNKNIVDLALLIGRTPSALAMKCVNIASIDPKIRESGRVGLSNASALDRRVWEEAHRNWDATIAECETLTSYLRQKKKLQESVVEDSVADELRDFTGAVRDAVVKQRVGQAFFRRTVLSGYGGKCCVSGVSDSRLLVASHIVSWRDDASIRLHPGNGLCLSSIHDRAFDSRLFSLTDDFRVVLSEGLRNTADKFLQEVFWQSEGKKIALPEKFSPEVAFVTKHRESMQAVAAVGNTND